jgi:hypothetical protein
MSRWAEVFASLSGGHDNCDKSDKRSGQPQRSDLLSAIVKTVEPIGYSLPATPNPAENLERANPQKPFVTFVTSVNGGNERGSGARRRPPAGIFDKSVTIATKGQAGPDHPEEGAAIIEYGANVPRRWAEGYAALCTMPAPTGFSMERWQRIVDATGNFLDRWGAEAIRCGWTDLDLFGVDADAPSRRFDCMGLLLLIDRMDVVAIDPLGADLVALNDTSATQRYRRKSRPVGTVPLWDLIVAEHNQE